MATKGWGRCGRCGSLHKSLLMRGPCNECLEKERKKAAIDRVATPEKLVENPSLAEIDAELNGWYG